MESQPRHDRPRRRRGGRRPSRAGRAFTLIELMVAVAIIALLIGILLPAMKNVKIQVKAAGTKSQFSALQAGNEAFRAEQAIGGSYVPSGTDSKAVSTSNPYNQMANPLADGTPSSPEMITPITGASLLVYGLAGADTLGTPGSRDLDGDGGWYDDQGNNSGDPPGAYFLDQTTFEPVHPRYGPYVDDKSFDRIRSIEDLNKDGVILNADDVFGTDALQDQKVFVDNWQQPILYYRALPPATLMITDPSGPRPGVFDHRDNKPFTGGLTFAGDAGVDLGNGRNHGIRSGKVAQPDDYPNLDSPSFDDTFVRFIWDRNVTQRATPVNRESFLLISAGNDGLYGTADDVTNWTRP